MTSTNDGSEPRTGDAVAAGSSRTPPPRSRRGAPTSRPTAIVDPEVVEPKSPKPAPATATTKQSGGSLAKPVSMVGAPEVERTSPAATTVAAAVGAAVPSSPVFGSGDPAALRPGASRPKVVKRPERRFRQTIVKVDLWSVTKMALCFYVSAVAVTVVALAALWVVADSAGIIGNVEKFIGDLFSSKDFHFVSGQVLRGAVLLAIVLVALLVAFTIIAASFYNIFAELFGGVEVVIREEEHPTIR